MDPVFTATLHQFAANLRLGHVVLLAIILAVGYWEYKRLNREEK